MWNGETNGRIEKYTVREDGLAMSYISTMGGRTAFSLEVSFEQEYGGWKGRLEPGTLSLGRCL